MHKMLLGIEHLMTGLQLTARDNPGNKPVFTFQQESPSIVCVLCDDPFMAYWPPKQSFLESTECAPEEIIKYEQAKPNEGEAEWWAKVAGEALRQTYHLPTANITGNQPPDVVTRAMRRKHGKEADKYIQQLRWDGMNKCWYYTYAGMYLGVEEDGYIHS